MARGFFSDPSFVAWERLCFFFQRAGSACGPLAARGSPVWVGKLGPLPRFGKPVPFTLSEGRTRVGGCASAARGDDACPGGYSNQPLLGTACVGTDRRQAAFPLPSGSFPPPSLLRIVFSCIHIPIHPCVDPSFPRRLPVLLALLAWWSPAPLNQFIRRQSPPPGD